MSETKKSTRSSRDSGAHVNQARRQPWRPVRKLETPPAPPGYVYRWIRESMLGSEDRANVSRRLREDGSWCVAPTSRQSLNCRR
jgi:hypothetical protein